MAVLFAKNFAAKGVSLISLRSIDFPQRNNEINCLHVSCSIAKT
jgi:hypothetical protein